MKRYIKLNEQNEIIDLLIEDFKSRFYGTEIEFDDVDDESKYYHINGKCVRDEFGNPRFTYANGRATEIASSVYTIPSQNAQAAPVARAERNARIAAIDKYRYAYERAIAIGKTPEISDDQYKSILTYIQELCDVPEQSGFPLDVTWPTMPAI